MSFRGICSNSDVPVHIRRKLHSKTEKISKIVKISCDLLLPITSINYFQILNFLCPKCNMQHFILKLLLTLDDWSVFDVHITLLLLVFLLLLLLLLLQIGKVGFELDDNVVEKRCSNETEKYASISQQICQRNLFFLDWQLLLKASLWWWWCLYGIDIICLLYTSDAPTKA